MSGIEAGYAEVRTPIVAVNALDDLWATPRSRDAFMQAYRNVDLKREDLDPRQHGGAIGHMGYFRASAQPLWDRALDWFAALLRSPGLS